eukprot:13907709-Alexandrium_andersonii.AAC.1
MSASLVGSEMCIRDSPRAERQLRLLGKCGKLRTQRRWEGMLRGSPSTAVSYTHLTLPTICSV